MPSDISRHNKKPILRAFSVYTFHVFFKKSISITPTKRTNRSSHHQFACSIVPSVSFVSFASLTSQLFRSFVCACRSRASHRYTRLTLSCHARFACTHSLHRSTHSFRCFVCSLIPLISRPSLFTCFSHMPGSYVGYLHDQSSIPTQGTNEIVIISDYQLISS